MTKRQWLWLLSWFLLFFMLFCSWSKGKTFYKGGAPIAIISETNRSNETTRTPSTKAFEDISFKAFKESGQESVKLSGIVESQEERENIIDSFSKVFEKIDVEELEVKEGIKSDKIDADLLATFAPFIAKFDSGYIEYNQGTFTIDGITYDKLTKEDIDEAAQELKKRGIEVENLLTFQSPPPKEFPWKELLKIETNESNESHMRDLSNEQNETNQSVVIAETNSSDSNLSTKVEVATKESLQKQIDEILKSHKVHFLYAKDVMTNKSQATVLKIINLLKNEKYQKFIIEIGGHTDSDGTKRRNRVLSQKRAIAVKNYMIKHGIDPKRLKAVGYGESRPLVPNNSAKNKKINRRVEFKVIGEIE